MNTNKRSLIWIKEVKEKRLWVFSDTRAKDKVNVCMCACLCVWMKYACVLGRLGEINIHEKIVFTCNDKQTVGEELKQQYGGRDYIRTTKKTASEKKHTPNVFGSWRKLLCWLQGLYPVRNQTQSLSYTCGEEDMFILTPTLKLNFRKSELC